MFGEYFATLFLAALLVAPRTEAFGSARHADPEGRHERREKQAERKLRRHDDGEEDQGEDDDERSRPRKIFRHLAGQELAGVAASAERFARELDGPEHEA